jgi:acyl-CoA thioester hydrolase
VRYRDLERDEGVLLAVVDAHCRYISPARYDEEVLITTSISNSNRRMVEFAYDMRNESGGRIARGATKHMFLGPDMKPARLPEKYHGLFGIE